MYCITPHCRQCGSITIPRALSQRPVLMAPRKAVLKGTCLPAPSPVLLVGVQLLRTIKHLPDSRLRILGELFKINACTGKNPDPTLKQAHATTPVVIKTEFAPPSVPKLGCSAGQKLSPIFNHGLFTLTYSSCQHCIHIISLA